MSVFFFMVLFFLEVNNIHFVNGQCASAIPCDDKENEGCAHHTQSCSGSSVYCRGYRGCYDGKNEITIQALGSVVATYNTYCNGDFGCYKANTISADHGTTYCQGNSACSNSLTVYGETRVYCEAENSCLSVNEIKSDGIINCNGRDSCKQAGSITAVKEVYCNGKGSCSNVINGITSSNDNIECYGSNSCDSSSLTVGNNNEIHCLGKQSCKGSSSITGKYIFCQGDESCSYTKSVISSNGNIYCSGKRGCYNSEKLEANNGWIWCESYQSCMSAVIPKSTSSVIASVKYDIYCYGSESCKNLHISSSIGIAGCVGESACEQAIMTAPIVVCGATDSCSSATIKGAHTIDALGVSSLGGAIIDTTGVSTMTIRFFGYESGDGTTIDCKSGTTCNVNCVGNACTNLNYICETGATCNGPTAI